VADDTGAVTEVEAVPAPVRATDAADHDPATEGTPATEPASGETPATEPAGGETPVEQGRRRGLRRRKGAGAEATGSVSEETAADRDPARRLSLPLVPVLAVLLVLLVAGCVALWVTRPAESAVRTDAYVGALQAARAGIVDVASFDYVTLDDDIKQIRDVTTGDLQKESIDQLDQRRQQITDAKAVVNTTVVGAAVGKADRDSATVFAVIQSTQQTSASAQAQVQRYRVEIALTRVHGRWLLSGITGR
jgi:Mce-associated membrane protein